MLLIQTELPSMLVPAANRLHSLMTSVASSAVAGSPVAFYSLFWRP